MKTVDIRRKGNLCYSFTDEDLEDVRFQVEYELKTRPELYTDFLIPSVKYKGEVICISENLIIDQSLYGAYNQLTRDEGISPKEPETRASILQNGFKLHSTPIFVRRSKIKRGYYEIVDGATRHLILRSQGVKNRLVVVIEIDDAYLTSFGNLANNASGSIVGPSGTITEKDVIRCICGMIDDKTINATHADVLDHINKICYKGKFTEDSRKIIADKVMIMVNKRKEPTDKLLSATKPEAWVKESVKQWLNQHGYRDTDTVAYFPWATGGVGKCLTAVAAFAMEEKNKNKKIRIIPFVSSISGLNEKTAYVKAITKFDEGYRRTVENVSFSLFKSAKNDGRIDIYGYVPSNVEGICDDMNILVNLNNTTKASFDNIVGSNLNKFILEE